VRELPSGTVTLLFTDIEGSTRLLEELGEGYADVLAGHRRRLREAFERHGGVEVDTQGDAFFVAFDRAHDATAAAADAQEGLRIGHVRVRMGLHTGEPRLTEEGYVGVDVHRAARIMSAGHGGQVLVSQSTRDLVAADFDLRDLGEHVLKDVGAVRIYQLGGEDFPPLRSLSNTNLPARLEPLVGRKRELADLLKLIRIEGVRLVTLTGPGGVGKTRLGLELASELVPQFDHGVWFVDLSAIRDSELVRASIASILGANRPLEEHIGDRKMLVAVDNFEQVLDAASVVSDLTKACAHLSVVCTSREALRVSGEREYSLRPLGEAPAVELFRRRADAAGAAMDASFDEVADLCRWLDRLPLAIELAAARAKTLRPHEVREGLERRLPLLTRGRRDAPERHRTLRAAIDWSYELCEADERQLFRRLGVFAGGWDVEAVERVCGGDRDLLAALVDKSLVRHRDGRYALLDTIREYAEERLAAEGETDFIGERHARYFADLAETTNLDDRGVGEPRYDVARRELDNFRRALDWCVVNGNRELGMCIARGVMLFWLSHDPWEGQRWFETLLADDGEVSPVLRADGLLALGGLVFIVGEFERGTHIYEQALEAYRALGDTGREADVLDRLANAALARGEVARARAFLDESLEIHRRFGDRRGETVALGSFAGVEWRDGNHERALELAAESAAMARDLGFAWWEAQMVYSLCEWTLELGRAEDAERFGREALELSARIGERQLAVYLLALLARLAGRRGQSERAGVLWGAVEAEERRGSVGQWERERESYAAAILDEPGPDFEGGRMRGRTLTLDEAVEAAVGVV
jgi:predicted ATPase